MADESSDPLQLEHMMGFNGDCRGSVQFLPSNAPPGQQHPEDTNVMISYTGCLLVISNVNNPHEQQFLRGHNEAITCLAISPSGNMIASGQGSSNRVPNSEATVIVWDYATKRPIYRLMELHDGIHFSHNKVINLSFSPDERWLAASDDQHDGPKMCIWDTKTAQLAIRDSKVYKYPLDFIVWGEITATPGLAAKHPTYSLLTASQGKLHKHMLSFDVRTMQHMLSSDVFQLPSTGLPRTYYGAAYTKDLAKNKSYLVTGSSAGELCIFSADELVFRAAVPVSTGGLLSLAMMEDDAGDLPPMVYCGCGNGVLKILQGTDLEWVCLRETALEGEIRSLTLSADKAEVLAGTSTGDIYRLDAQTLEKLDMRKAPTSRSLLASHAAPISCVAFSEDSSEWFMTSSESGTMRRWELSEYSVEYEIAPPVKTTDATAITRAQCLELKDGTVLSGWSDGAIRAYDQDSGTFLWSIPTAHKAANGGVTCIGKAHLHSGAQYLVSAGGDGALHIWPTGASKALVGAFEEHQNKPVTGLCIDHKNPALVHSCSEGKSIVTVDLEQARRTVSHTVKEGALKTMTQVTTGELELITGDAAGILKFWDCDEAQPVSMTATWHPQDEPAKSRVITHLDPSPPLGEGSPGSDFLLACTASGDVQVWDLAGGKTSLVSVGAAHSEEVSMARWAPDCKQVVSVGKDACICVWNFYAD